MNETKVAAKAAEGTTAKGLSFRKLTPREIEVRVQQCGEKMVRLLLYKDARCDMNLLDETVGASNWKKEYTRNNANCIVSIYDPEKEQWVSKEDVGTESNTEAAKGLASDSFKRACVCWGIGRELYTAPDITVWASGATIKAGPRGGFACYDKFSVAEIAYDETGCINQLKIKNDTLNKVVFAMDTRPKEEKTA